MASPEPPSVTEIIDVHRRIVEEYDTYRGTRHPNPEAVLENIVSNAAAAESPAYAAAELFDGIIRTHVFEDGNKRTATVVSVSTFDGLVSIPQSRLRSSPWRNTAHGSKSTPLPASSKRTNWTTRNCADPR
jgi:hypothetical protein